MAESCCIDERCRDILPKSFFRRKSCIVAPELIGCMLVKQGKRELLTYGVIVETEAYSQEEQSCHGFNRRTKSIETLFGEPGNLYVYLTYGMYFCVNIVTEKKDWASGVLLRAIAMPKEDERIASGPALIAKRFEINKSHDNIQLSLENGIWIAKKLPSTKMHKIVQTTRIGISKAQDLHWRWYMKSSRSVSKRIKGDRMPPPSLSWRPSIGNKQ